MLFRNALIYRSSHALAARLRRHRHGPQPAGGQGLRDLLREHVRPHAGHTKGYAMLAQICGQLRHLGMVADRRPHEPHLFRSRRTALNVRNNLLQLARSRLSKAVARHAKAAVTATAASDLHDVHILKFRTTAHDGCGVGIGIDITHPLTLYYCGSLAAFLDLQSGKAAVLIVLCLVKRRHIHPRHLRQLGKALSFTITSVDDIQNPLHRVLALADDKGIGYGCQRLRIEGGAGPTDNHQRLALVSLRRPQLDIAQIQNGEQIVIVHFKREHDKNHCKISQGLARFHAEQRGFAFHMLLNEPPLRQKETLAGTVPPGVDHLI